MKDSFKYDEKERKRSDDVMEAVRDESWRVNGISINWDDIEKAVYCGYNPDDEIVKKAMKTAIYLTDRFSPGGAMNYYYTYYIFDELMDFAYDLVG